VLQTDAIPGPKGVPNAIRRSKPLIRQELSPAKGHSCLSKIDGLSQQHVLISKIKYWRSGD
jgi:hypothetical protein